MPEPGTDQAIVAGMAPGGPPPPDWRRRQLVVDARYQLRAGVLVGMVAIVLLVLLNAALIPQARKSVGQAMAASTTRPPVGGQDRASWALVLVGSAVFLGGVVLVGVLESHRTAGAAYAIRRAVDAIRDGRPEIRVRLRRGDHLQDLAHSVNQLAERIDAERLRRG